jgi:Ca2+-binding RTX toxin-like protein
VATISYSSLSAFSFSQINSRLDSAATRLEGLGTTLEALDDETVYVYSYSNTRVSASWGSWDATIKGSNFESGSVSRITISSVSLVNWDSTRFSFAGNLNLNTGGTITSMSYTSSDGATSIKFQGSFKLNSELEFASAKLSSFTVTSGGITLTVSGNLTFDDTTSEITAGTVTGVSLSDGVDTFSASGLAMSYSDFDALTEDTGSVALLLNAISKTGNDSIVGGDGNDSIAGESGNDTLRGGDENDTLDGGSGNDSLVGGAGDDLYVVNSSKDIVVESKDAGEDTIESSVSYTLSANVETLQLTGSLDINATGNALANSLIGNSGANILNGGIGADTMQGGDGDDTYLVDQTGDVVTESENEGTDTIRIAIATKGGSYSLGDHVENGVLTNSVAFSLIGNDLNNTLTGNAAANTLDGGIGNDSLLGGAGNDSLLGGAGDDTLDGGVGNDTMDGGEGSDLYFVNATGDLIADSGTGLSDIDVVQSTVNYTLNDGVENLILTGNGSLFGTGSNQQNVITGNTGANRLDGGAGDDTLYGGLGADSLIGGLGADQLEGGAGNDTYEVDDLGDVVTELANEGTDLISSSIDYTLGDYLENLTLTGTGHINATGNSLNNTLIGNDGNNVLTGGAGIDVLKGGKGNDTYQINLISSGTGTKAVAKLEDSISEAAAASGGDDTLALQGTFSGLSKATVLTLAAGLEHLDASATGDTWLNLSGNAANNALTGNDADNILRGLAGNDSLSGGDGADTLYGGLGNDSLTGGDGADVFVFDSKLGATNEDTITDFEVGMDKLQLSKTIFSKFTVAGGVSDENLLITNNSSQALDANDYLIFDATDGSLYYDKDGNGAGVAVKFATLADLNGTLTADDFIVGA